MTNLNTIFKIILLSFSLVSCSKKEPLQYIKYINRYDCAIFTYNFSFDRDKIGFSNNVDLVNISNLEEIHSSNKEFSAILIDGTISNSLTLEDLNSIYSWLFESNFKRQVQFFRFNNLEFLDNSPFEFNYYNDQIPLILSYQSFSLVFRDLYYSNTLNRNNMLSKFASYIQEYEGSL